MSRNGVESYQVVDKPGRVGELVEFITQFGAFASLASLIPLLPPYWTDLRRRSTSGRRKHRAPGPPEAHLPRTCCQQRGLDTLRRVRFEWYNFTF